MSSVSSHFTWGGDAVSKYEKLSLLVALLNLVVSFLNFIRS